jgi:hypothetical protein
MLAVRVAVRVRVRVNMMLAVRVAVRVRVNMMLAVRVRVNMMLAVRVNMMLAVRVRVNMMLAVRVAVRVRANVMLPSLRVFERLSDSFFPTFFTGKFTRLQFDDSYMLAGSRCVTYLLEKVRTACPLLHCGSMRVMSSGDLTIPIAFRSAHSCCEFLLLLQPYSHSS